MSRDGMLVRRKGMKAPRGGPDQIDAIKQAVENWLRRTCFDARMDRVRRQ
ncbi:MAG: hypothetical protein ACJAVS_001665 [Paracoccaceae bacterium]|jgi:hypothetical protein